MGYFIHDIDSPARAAAGLRDARGCPVRTGSADALAHLEAALESMLSYFGDPMQALEDAIRCDPGWGHPRVLKAGLLLTQTEYHAARQAAQELEAAALVAANAREQAHFAAASAAADGDWDAACDTWERILVEHPRDVAALLFAHLFDFYRGDALNLRLRPERVLPRWSPELPLYGYVLGMHAFGLEESGHHGQAEDAGRAALDVNRRDPWAIHAVAHVFEMQGRHEDGTRWLSGRAADWAGDNGMAFHHWFHCALFHLERMETAAALAIHDRHLAPATDTALQRVDATAILWRLKLLGVDVTGRFQQLRGFWHDSGPEAGFYAFNDVHALLAHIGAGDTGARARSRDGLLACMAMPESCGSSNRRMACEVGLPLARALTAYARNDFAGACEGLLQVRDRAQGFGGSHAQRDILTLTLLDAAVRSGRRDLAAHLLNERGTKAGTALTAWWRRRIGANA